MLTRGKGLGKSSISEMGKKKRVKILPTAKLFDTLKTITKGVGLSRVRPKLSKV